MFKNDEEEPGENNNNKYIMFSKDDKNENIELANIENQNEQQNDKNTNESNEIFSSSPYKNNLDEKEKDKINKKKRIK